MNNPRLIYLYQLYIDNNCTNEELQELEVLFRNQENDGDFKRLLDNTWDELAAHQLTDLSQSKADQIYQEIVQQQSRQQLSQLKQEKDEHQENDEYQKKGEKQEKDQQQKVDHQQEYLKEQEYTQQQRPNYRLWMGIAASFVLVLSITLSFYKHIPKATLIAGLAKKRIAKDILPGTEKAVLTLSNGNKVVLGKIRSGQTNNPLVFSSVIPKSTAADSDDQQNTIAIPLAGQYHLTLPDGTLVYLNSASTLSYPTKFIGNARVVTLIGEAYFEVAKNPKMPFRVNVNNEQQIEVLGTHFNVKAYPDEHMISTTLLEGSVKVTARNQQVMLKPGQAAINNSASTIMVKPADLEEVMAWKNGMFIFNNESITEIMKKISRWYDVEVVYQGNMENIYFTGNYSRSKSLSSLLQNIELMEKVHFNMEERRITVIEK